MTPADEYRTKAMEFAAKAQRELDRLCRLQYEMLAQSYLRLATQAEQNSRADLVYETPVGSARATAAARRRATTTTTTAASPTGQAES